MLAPQLHAAAASGHQEAAIFFAFRRLEALAVLATSFGKAGALSSAESASAPIAKPNDAVPGQPAQVQHVEQLVNQQCPVS